LFASPNPNPNSTAYHICDPSATSQNTMCIRTYSLCWLQNVHFQTLVNPVFCWALPPQGQGLSLALDPSL
jgi:hypothetical protein